MKITDTTDFFFFSHSSSSAAGALFCSTVRFVRLYAFLLSSSSKILFFLYSLFCHHYLSHLKSIWLCVCFFFVISLIFRCVCVMCMENKRFYPLAPAFSLSLSSERKDGQSKSLMERLHFDIGLGMHTEHFKCKALNFEVYFAPFVWKAVEKFCLFFFHPTHSFSFFWAKFDIWIFTWSSFFSVDKKAPRKKRHQSMVRHYNTALLVLSNSLICVNLRVIFKSWKRFEMSLASSSSFFISDTIVKKKNRGKWKPWSSSPRLVLLFNRPTTTLLFLLYSCIRLMRTKMNQPKCYNPNCSDKDREYTVWYFAKLCGFIEMQSIGMHFPMHLRQLISNDIDNEHALLINKIIRKIAMLSIGCNFISLVTIGFGSFFFGVLTSIRFIQVMVNFFSCISAEYVRTRSG